MFKLVATAGFFSISVALYACATLNEDECRTVNWGQLGDIDGSQGHHSTRIAKHSKACNKHGLPVDTAAYNDGWLAGISRYCVPQNGFNLGRRGATYRGSCPSQFASAFVAAYRPAKNLHDAVKSLRSTELSIDQDIDEIALLSRSKDPKDREKLKHVSERLSVEKSDLPRLRSNVELANRDVADYLRSNPHIKGS